MKNKCEHCDGCEKSTHRDEVIKKKLNKRLKTIEEQIRGIQNMIDSDAYCNDVLIQLLAISKSIKSVSNEIFRDTYEIKDGKAIKLIQGISEKQDGYNGELTDEVLNQEKEAFDEFYIKTTS